MLLTDILEKNANAFPQKCALIMRRGFRTLKFSYKDIYSLSLRVGPLLEKSGVKKGDAVLIFSPNSPFWVSVFWGVLLRGAVVVPLNIQSTREMIGRIARQTEAKIIFAHPGFKAAIPEGLRIFDIELLQEEISAMNPSEFKKSEANESDIAEIIYTSGTTGEPKGVPLTHKNIVSNVEAVAKVIPVSVHDRFLSILPLSHIYEQVAGFLIPFRAGATIVYTHSPAAIRELMQEYRITKMAAVPEFLRIVMTKMEAKARETGKENILKAMMQLSRRIGWKPLGRLLFRSLHKAFGRALHTISSGGAPLDPELENKWDALGIWLLQGYGLTETSPVVSTNTYDAHRPRSVGKALPGVEIKIAPDKEVLVKGPNVFRGYFKNEEKTKEAFTADGWFKTEDIGELDKDGFLFLKGRKKYMILGEGGQNVYPEDIEFELNKDPRVKDGAVVGLKKAAGREEIHAVLLLSEGVNQKEAGDIIDKTNARLASYQRIGGWSIWWDVDFPRSATRKVKKEEVLAWLRGKKTLERRRESARKAIPPLYQLLAEITATEPSRIKKDMRIVPELNLDSLLRVELVARIEETFGVSVAEAKITPETTVAELEAMIEAAPEMKKTKIKHWPITPWASLMRFLGQQLLFLPIARIFVRLRVEGREHLQDLKLPSIFAPNHISYLDSLVLLMALPLPIRRKLAFAAARDVVYEYFKYLAPAIELFFNSFPFPRREGEDIRSGLEHMGRMLDKGCSVAIYPEGQMSEDDKLLPLKRGIGLVAVEMDADIVPVKISGTSTILPYAKIIPRKRSGVLVKFGGPLRFGRKVSYDAAKAEIEKALREL